MTGRRRGDLGVFVVATSRRNPYRSCRYWSRATSRSRQTHNCLGFDRLTNTGWVRDAGYGAAVFVLATSRRWTSMLSALRRHPIPIEARFEWVLVLTYALPERFLQPFLPPSITLDSFAGWGFLAVAMVQTRQLRPQHVPASLGRDFFLAGYRIFTRLKTSEGRSLRGLKILRSDTDKASMVLLGNLFTQYEYHRATVECVRKDDRLTVALRTHGGVADLRVLAHTGTPAEAPPPGSPFADLKAARRFAGPLPHTFAYDARARATLVVRGIRRDWEPMPVEVEVEHCAFLQQDAFRGAETRLANAFFIEQVDYRWERGYLEPFGTA